MGSALAVIATVVTLWNTLDPWPKIGWMTIATHDALVASLVLAHATDIQNIELDHSATEAIIDEFFARWQCDEWQEELLDLLRNQAAGDDSIKTSERIKTLREKMREERFDCKQFDN